jgi:hypothetical protein
MAPDERLARWKSNYAHISVHTAQMWADHFITELNETCVKALKHNTLQPAVLSTRDVAEAFAGAERRLVVIGYNTAMTVTGTGTAAQSPPPGRAFSSADRRNKARCAPRLLAALGLRYKDSMCAW